MYTHICDILVVMFFMGSILKSINMLLHVCVLGHYFMSDSLRTMDCSPPGASVHEMLQARILEWVAIPFFRVSSQPRDRTGVSHITNRFFTIRVTRVAQLI